MRRVARHRFTLCSAGSLLLLLALASGGCVSEYGAEFEGRVMRGGQAVAPQGVHELGGQFSRWPDASPDALYGFDMPGGSLIVVVDRKAVLAGEGRPSNGTVTAVYWSTAASLDDARWDRFLLHATSARDRFPDTRRLSGTFDIRRWKHNLDYRIDLAMRSDGPESYEVVGTVAEYSRWEFLPHKWLAMSLFHAGWVGEGG